MRRTDCFEVGTDVELVRRGPVCDWGMRYRTVIGFGVAEVDDADAEKRRAFELFAVKYGGITRPETSPGTCRERAPSWTRGRCAASGGAK